MYQKLFCSLAVLSFLFAFGYETVSAQSRSETEVLQLVNRERSRMRMGTLLWDERIARVARDYSRQMAREGFFDHYDPRGRTVMDRAARVPDWSEIGENLFVCDPHEQFAAIALRGWMKSTTHRTNLLNRQWTATGIGIATDRDGRIFITQVFTRDYSGPPLDSKQRNWTSMQTKGHSRFAVGHRPTGKQEPGGSLSPFGFGSPGASGILLGDSINNGTLARIATWLCCE